MNQPSPASHNVIPNLSTDFLGLIPYSVGREIQADAIKLRRENKSPDKLLLCEHPAVLTCGTRTRDVDLPIDRREFEIVKASRGGSVTWHGPGQLVIYPVISLRERHLGVRRFVELGLQSIVDTLAKFGISAVARTDLAGVWVETSRAPAKIASVGLKIEHGISNHGFSLNVSNDLAVYQKFTSCGLSGVAATSICALSGRKFSLEEVAFEIALAFSANFR